MAVNYDLATRCCGCITEGAIACRDHWERTTGLGNYGIYSCRPPRGQDDGYSVHAEGRAVDLACNAFDPDQLLVGDNYAAWLIANFDELQVQRIIWRRKSWRCDRGVWEYYSGVNPHYDHLHVELSELGAAHPSPLWESAPPSPGGFLMSLSDQQQQFVFDTCSKLNALIGPGENRVGIEEVLERFSEVARDADEARMAAQNAVKKANDLMERLEAVESTVLKGDQKTRRILADEVEASGDFDEGKLTRQETVTWRENVADNNYPEPD